MKCFRLKGKDTQEIPRTTNITSLQDWKKKNNKHNCQPRILCSAKQLSKAGGLFYFFLFVLSWDDFCWIIFKLTDPFLWQICSATEASQYNFYFAYCILLFLKFSFGSFLIYSSLLRISFYLFHGSSSLWSMAALAALKSLITPTSR